MWCFARTADRTSFRSDLAIQREVLKIPEFVGITQPEGNKDSQARGVQMLKEWM